MKFYQVKREADNKKLDKNWNIFVGGELFTEKEMGKYGRRWTERAGYMAVGCDLLPSALYDYIASVPSQLHAAAVELVKLELS